jgi:hypothetical protein
MRLFAGRKSHGLIVLGLLALFGCAGRHRAHDPLRINAELSTVSLGDYSARNPRRLSSLPDSVQRRAREYMLDRLGPEFFARLEFAGGQVVDSARMYREDPFTRDFEWPIFGYRLGWRFRDPVLGIDSYVGVLTLDWAGHPMEDAEFPPIRQEPIKSRLLSIGAALDSVRLVGMRPERIRMDYLQRAAALVYEFHQTIESIPLHGGRRRILVMEAHSGRVLTDTVVRVSY